MAYRSRFTLWLIEAIIAINLIYLSAVPLIKGYRKSPDDSGVYGYLEYFLTGTGADTLALWLRILALVVGILLLFLWPVENCPRWRMRARVYSELTIFMLFLFVFWLGIIFGKVTDFLWVQALVYSAIMGTAYISNSWWGRKND